MHFPKKAIALLFLFVFFLTGSLLGPGRCAERTNLTKGNDVAAAEGSGRAGLQPLTTGVLSLTGKSKGCHRLQLPPALTSSTFDGTLQAAVKLPATALLPYSPAVAASPLLIPNTRSSFPYLSNLRGSPQLSHIRTVSLLI